MICDRQRVAIRLKWERLKDAIQSLHGRTVLDVGCGNGFYLSKMIDEGAELALGIDPTTLFLPV